jgi:hypothetical protein
VNKVPEGFKIYKDEDGNYIFLDDVVMDDDPEEIDRDKLPARLRALKSMQFIWLDDIMDYVLCVPLPPRL